MKNQTKQKEKRINKINSLVEKSNIIERLEILRTGLC